MNLASLSGCEDILEAKVMCECDDRRLMRLTSRGSSRTFWRVEKINFSEVLNVMGPVNFSFASSAIAEANNVMAGTEQIYETPLVLQLYC